MIPKIIHYLWMSDQKTPDAECCIASWKEKMSDYEIKEWNKSNFPYQDFIWTKEASSQKKWAFVTDFFRLWVLYNYGGIYLDADVTATGRFDDFLNQPLFIGTEFTDQIAAHAIGAEKGHPFIHRCLHYYENRHFVKSDGSLDMKPMPNIITKVFMSQYHYDGVLVQFDGKPYKISDMTIYPDSYFTINIYDGNNVCYHNGLGSWRDKNTAENPIMENVIGSYFMKRFFCKYMLQKYTGLKKIFLLLLPLGVVSYLYKRKMKICNNTRVKSVEL